MSFILLGILNSQAAGVAAGSYDLLETTILSSDAASITFSNLVSTYGSDYKHLQIRSVARDSTGTSDGIGSLHLTFNGDTASNYAGHRTEVASINQGIVSTGQTSTAEIDLVITARNGSGTSDNFVAGIIDILDPFSTSKNTTVRCFSGGSLIGYDTSDGAVSFRSGAYFQTSAIDSINLESPLSDTQAGSRFSLYGIKAA